MEHAGSGRSRVALAERCETGEMKEEHRNWHPTGPLRDHPRSILVVMMSAVGDAIQVLPVVSALRRAFPDTHISWVLQPDPLSLVDGHPAVNEFVPFERGARGRGFPSLISGMRGVSSTAKALGQIAARQPGGAFDLLLDLQVYFKAGLLTALVPARVKLGFDWRRARDLNWLFTTHRIPPHPARFGHIQDQYFEFLRYVGVDPEPLEYGLTLSGEERVSQRRFFKSLGGPACAVVLGASDHRKNWTPRGYAEVVSELRGRFQLNSLLVGGHSVEEERMARAIMALSGEGVVDARGGGLRRLLWLLDGASLVISPDTGPLHMARAMGVPVVGLFGLTNPKRSGPYHRFAELVVDGYARFPGEAYGVNMDRRPGGMDRITPGMVLEKVEMALR